VVANSGTVEQLEFALAAVLEKLDAAAGHPDTSPSR
jgi:hypothetical protein